MKKIMKRISTALTAALLLLSVLVSCTVSRHVTLPITSKTPLETAAPTHTAVSSSALPSTAVYGTASDPALTGPDTKTLTETSKAAIPVTDPVINTDTSEGPVIPDPDPACFEIKLSFAGDVMLATNLNVLAKDNFRDYAEKKDPSYFLEKVGSYFDNDDFSLVNLECVLSDSEELTPIEKEGERVFWYVGSASNTRIITSYGIEAVSLSNNHAGDYGNQGRTDTIKAVEDAGLIWGNDSNTIYYEKNGYRIAIITTGLWASWWWKSRILPRLEDAKKNSDFQIIYWHGGTEKIHAPEDWKVEVSHLMVDAGADLVIGNHPHVLQPREIYNGVPIFYSIGNFCYGGAKRPENRTVIYQYTLSIGKDSLELAGTEENIIPCYVYTGNINNFQPAPIEDETEKQKVLDFLNGITESPL